MILKKIKNRVSGWRPLVLHWRRRRVLRPILRTDRVTSLVVSQSYFPQIHFHFTTQVRNQYQRLGVQTTVKRNRVLFESRWVTQINTNSTDHTNTLFFASPIQKRFHESRASASFTSVFPTRQSTRHAELTKVFKTHSLVREQRSQVLSFRSERETLLKTAEFYFNRAEELIWRREQLRTTAVEDAPVSRNLETSYRQLVRTPTPTVETTHVQSAPATTTPATSTQTTSTQTTAQQLPKLDPVLLDRLTDDVIRRVEKRALIERQRRGL